MCVCKHRTEEAMTRYFKSQLTAALFGKRPGLQAWVTPSTIAAVIVIWGTPIVLVLRIH